MTMMMMMMIIIIIIIIIILIIIINYTQRRIANADCANNMMRQ